MRLTLICRVIDNFGDAGFSLRLASALARLNYPVQVLCDQASLIRQLAGSNWPELVELTHIHDQTELQDALKPTDGVIECFGSSNCPDSPLLNSVIRSVIGQKPWAVVDYLSAEPWVEHLHGVSSVDPFDGYKSVYLYPGFSDKTGGLIHCDAAPVELTQPEIKKTHSIFVFCYANAPVDFLSNALKDTDMLTISDMSPVQMQQIAHQKQPAVALEELDSMLATHDWLFVRGEDSFVRAQLTGKPMVWQIYPTPDGAHEVKLMAFLGVYCVGLTPEVKADVVSLWRAWNGLEPPEKIATAWQALYPNYQTLQTHALAWARKLREGPELVSVILTALRDSSLYS
ncbi:MAG: elongation factor P maturation arginine rhamnosyltransferase EarP [Limnobacter sp.]|nr:elongation factor P maturation arginine rhamnosyltransferase EarP [Limnobacter sp.]